jgi:hypothetical protein
MEVQTEVNVSSACLLICKILNVSPVQVGIFKRLGWAVVREPVLFEGLDGVFPMWVMQKAA